MSKHECCMPMSFFRYGIIITGIIHHPLWITNRRGETRSKELSEQLADVNAELRENIGLQRSADEPSLLDQIVEAGRIGEQREKDDQSFVNDLLSLSSDQGRALSYDEATREIKRLEQLFDQLGTAKLTRPEREHLIKTLGERLQKLQKEQKASPLTGLPRRERPSLQLDLPAQELPPRSDQLGEFTSLFGNLTDPMGSSTSTLSSKIPPFIALVSVHFSITAPATAASASTFELQFWAHLDNQRKLVLERARQAIVVRDEVDLLVKSHSPF